MDEQGRATTFTPDGLGRVKTVTRAGLDPQGSPVSLTVAQYAYQSYSDSLSRVTDGKGLNTSYRYDDFGRLWMISSSNLKAGAITFSYDARGNLLQRKDNYVTVGYTYDGLNRLLTVSASNNYDQSSVAYTYHYDEAPYPGQLTSVIEPERVVRYGYDAAGRLARETTAENGVSIALVTQYSYDVDGAVSDIFYPSGLHLHLIRDPATRQVVQLRNVADGTLYASHAAHLPGGSAQSLTFGNGLTLSLIANRRYEPQAISSGPLSLAYGVTPAGDIDSVTESGATRTFQYDFLDRLTTSSGWFSYGYDNNGNRTSQQVDNVATTCAYTNDLMTVTLGANGTSQVPRFGYAYDYQTNVSGIGLFNASGTSVTAGLCLRHDALGRLVAVGIPKTLSAGYFNGSIYCGRDSDVQAVTTRFKYDSRNRRVAAWSVASNQWVYVISDASGNPLSELIKTNDPLNPWVKYRDYVWLDGKPLAQIEYPGPAGSEQGYVYYYHLDHIGMPRALTNQAGQTVWSATARPYGDIVESTTTDPLSNRVVVTNLRLPGQYDERLLGSLGLQGPYYNWNRWYLPGVGRYLELDPQWLATVPHPEEGVWFAPDWYGYAAGNPLRYVDPYGLCNLSDEGAHFDAAYSAWLHGTPGLGCGPINGICNALPWGNRHHPMCVDMSAMLVQALQKVQSECCKPEYSEHMWPRPLDRAIFYHATVKVKCKDDCAKQDVELRNYDPYWRSCLSW